MTRNKYFLTSRILVMLVLFLLPIFFSLWPCWSLNYGKELLFQFLAILALCFWGIGALRERTFKERIVSFGKPLRLPIYMFVAVLIWAALRSPTPFEGGVTLADILLGALLALVLSERIFVGAIKPHSILLLVLVGGVINAVMAIAQSTGWDPIFGIPIEEIGDAIVSGRRKVMGFMGNPVFASEYIAACLPISLAMLLTSRSLFRKAAWGLVMALFVVAVLATMTRAPTISIALGFGACFTFLSIISGKTGRLRKQRLVVASLLIGVALIYVVAFVNYGSVLDRYSERGSLDRRLSMWSNTYAMIKQAPIQGLGLAAFKYRYLDFQVGENLRRMHASPPEAVPLSPKGGLAHAHNEYLQIASETGAVGLFCFAFLAVSVLGFGLMSFRKAMRDNDSRELRDECIIVVALLTSLAMTLINALTGFPFHIAPTAILALVSVAIVMGLSRKVSRTDRSGLGRELHSASRTGAGYKRLARGCAASALLAASVAGLIYPMKAFIAEYHESMADGIRKSGSPQIAFERFIHASRFAPHSGRLAYKMALCESRMGQLENARILYDVARRNFNTPALLVASSETALGLGRLSEAILGFTQAFAYTQMGKYHSRLADIYLALADEFKGQGRLVLALGCLDEAGSLAPSVRILKNIAEVQDLRCTYEDAFRTREEIIRMDHFEIDTAYKIGEYYESREELHEAREAFEAVRRLDPDYRDVGDRILSITLMLSNRLEVTPLERSKDLYLMGKLSLEYGQIKLAYEMFQRAQEIGVKIPQAHLFMAKSLEKRGMLDQAEYEYRQALQLDPHDARPLLELFRLFNASGDEEKQEWLSRRISEFEPEYQSNKVLRIDSQVPRLPVGDEKQSHQEVLRGISIDDLSVQWEDQIAFTLVLDMLPVRGTGRDTLQLLRDGTTKVLLAGRKALVATESASLINGRDDFVMTEGAPPIIVPGDVPCPAPGPTSITLRTTEEEPRAVLWSNRAPIAPNRGYLLFYKVWASVTGAYIGKVFFDQSNQRLFFNRYPGNQEVHHWDWGMDYFAAPPEAHSVALFLALDKAPANAFFDEVILTPIAEGTKLGILSSLSRPSK